METSDVEQLPCGWSYVRLADIGSFLSGSGFPIVYQGNTSGDLPFFKVSDFSNPGNERTLNRANHYVDQLTRKKMGARLFPEGAIAFAKIGAAIFLERKRIIEQASCLDNNMAAFVLSAPKISRELILAHLQSFSLGSLVSSTALPAISSADLKGIKFPLPDDPKEQEAIAEALSDADALIEGLERLIAKKRLIKQGAMQDLLTAKRRLPGFSGQWKPLNLASLSHLKARIGWQGLTTQEYRKFGEHILVTGTDIVSGRVNWRGCVFVDRWRFDQDRNIQLRDDDILLTKDGTIGKVARVADMPGPAALNSGVFVIRPKNGEYHSGFAFHILSSSVFSDFLAKLTAGSTIVHLYQKDLVTFEFPAPDFEEQEAISNALDDMDAEIQALETRLEKARQVKEGMMQNLLTGRIRLV